MEGRQYKIGQFDLRWLFRQFTLSAILAALMTNWRGIYNSAPANVYSFWAMMTIAGGIVGGFIHCPNFGAAIGLAFAILWGVSVNYVPW
jgi:hypothetical protein